MVLDAGSVDGVAGGEVVGAVDHHVGIGHQRIEQRCVGALDHGGDDHIGVDGRNGLAHRSGLGAAHARKVVRDLALQVGFVDHVVVDHRDAPHARAAQVERHR